jgi:hypothetical protein
MARRPFKVVAVALANKMARMAWALLTFDAKRSRTSIGKPGKTYAQKERVNLIGTDQRITSGPALKRPHSKAEYMTAPEGFADSQFLSCTAGAVYT